MLGVRSFDPNADAGEHRHLANLMASTRKKENVGGMHRSAMAISGKSGMKNSVTFKTPFNAGKSENYNKGSQITIKASQGTFQRRALGEKTPLPNRDLFSLLTPVPRSASKKDAGNAPLPSLLDVVNGSTPTQPPSTGRKKARTPTSASKAFKTPVTKGDHWNVSDVSIEVGEENLEELDDEGEDYSDVEYMPPTAIVPPYEPPFELPDYKEVGEKLLQAAYSFPVNDPPKFNEDFDADEILKDSGWSPDGDVGLEVPEPEEDDPYLLTLASVKPPFVEKQPLRLQAQTRGTITRLGSIQPSNSTRSTLVSHTKSSNVPASKHALSRATSSSTIRPTLQSRPATVAARPTTRVATATSSRLATGNLNSARTLSTRSSVPNLGAASQRTGTARNKPAGQAQGKGKEIAKAPTGRQTLADARETKASLMKAVATIKELGGEAAKVLEKERAKAMKTKGRSQVGTIGGRAGTLRTSVGVNSSERVNRGATKPSAGDIEEEFTVLKFDDLELGGEGEVDFRFQI